MTWKLQDLGNRDDRDKHVRKCEHNWDSLQAQGNLENTYITYTCSSCSSEIELQLDIGSVCDQLNYYGEEIHSEVMLCEHCDERADTDWCCCCICPECGLVQTESDEDYACHKCGCEWCEEANGCTILQCKKCGEEITCETEAKSNPDDWVKENLCEDCWDDSQKTVEQKQEEAKALRKAAEALLLQAKTLEEN